MLSYRVCPQGWLIVLGALPGNLYVRVARDSPGSRWRIREVYMEGDEPITAELLRRLPLAEVEAAANLDSDVAQRYSQPGFGDQLGVLASHLGVGFGMRGRRPLAEVAAGDWVRAAMWSGLPQEYRESNGLGHLKPVRRYQREQPAASGNADFRLTKGPGADGLSDAFLTDLASAYRACLARGEGHPNRVIASDSGHALRTVQSWVYTARKRGFLPPARRGVAG